jgi:hypothetical protein
MPLAGFEPGTYSTQIRNVTDLISLKGEKEEKTNFLLLFL